MSQESFSEKNLESCQTTKIYRNQEEMDLDQGPKMLSKPEKGNNENLININNTGLVQPNIEKDNENFDIYSNWDLIPETIVPPQIIERRPRYEKEDKVELDSNSFLKKKEKKGKNEEKIIGNFLIQLIWK